MVLFKMDDTNRLSPIREKPFQKEKELQNICELNLELIFGLQFIVSEFALHNFRIDTLAFNQETKAFVIIEYKRSERFSVIDQGYAYLSLMLNNKPSFILEYNESCKQNLRRDEVDWTQSRVLFISPSFTNYQREAINFKDLPIELWEARQYEDRTISLSQLTSAAASASIKTFSNKNDTIAKVTNEVKVFTEDDVLNNTNAETTELYEILRDAILANQWC